MKSTTKLCGAALLAAIALVSFVAVSASGAKTLCESEGKVGSGKYGLCVEGKPMGGAGQTSVVTFSSALKPSTLALLVLPPGQFGASSIECKTVSAPGTFDTSAGKLELSKSLLINKYQPALAECTVTGDIASQCQLGSKEIIFNAESAPLAPSLEAIVFQPEGTSTVATFALVNKPSKTCALSVKGTYALGGHYSCKLPEASVEKLEHELSCAGALTFPSEQTAALSYAQMLSLSGTQKGKKFSIFESR